VTDRPDRSTRVPRPERAAADAGRSRLGDSTRPIARERRILTQRRSTALMALVALGIAGALAAALFVIPVRTLFDQDRRIEERGEQVAELESVVADLRSEVDRLGTTDGIREAAREELGYVEAGEIRETVLDYPDLPTDLPDGWPYSVVSGIAELRRGGPPPAQLTLAPLPSTPPTSAP
jgi:cell division protein FtsB